MKALTVQQPWAWAIMHGGKLIENRTQQWKYRGPLAIHAGNRWSDRGDQSPLILNASQGRTLAGVEPRGSIIGTVDLVDVHLDAGCCKPWGESAYTEHGGKERKAIVHLVLEDPRPLDQPINCAGALGLWTPPADIITTLEAHHGA
ncbi:ASCH domain-containing protein [Rhodococcoides fascians]|uniref:ASCH domain-containing protein n=1 Tax=Rhodococcoides fascians TaxID=1828 RepID=UPI00055C267D|nr:ASCH domain-containing protein [Rhodococcus fascians]